MAVDGGAAITSVREECDEEGNPVCIVVGILNEATQEKTYEAYAPK